LVVIHTIPNIHKDKIYNYFVLFVNAVAYAGVFLGGVQQIKLRTKGTENSDVGAVAP
jgi:hypothetical protein